jgi:PAT family beta-lactamase induction signal transducer AmpG
MSGEQRVRHPVLWVPTSYVAEGIPYAMITVVALQTLQSLGHKNSEITPVLASIGLSWSLKPLWAAFLDMHRTKKFFVLAMELLMALLFGLGALALGLPSYFSILIAVLWVAAFSSATQDICVDGVYITSLDKKGVAAWAGMQGVFWNVGRIFATSAVVGAAGVLIERGYLPRTAWAYAFGLSAVAMALLAIYHRLVLPTGSVARASTKTVEDVPASPLVRLGISAVVGAVLGAVVGSTSGRIIGVVIGLGTAVLVSVGWREHVPTFLSFVRKKSIGGMLLFVFLYRSGEGFLLGLSPLFMGDLRERGGLELSLKEMALINGLVSTLVGLVAGVLGGLFVARYGLKRTLLPLAFFMNVPHLCYVYLSQAAGAGHGLSLSTILLLVTVEKFGYSFGFVGNMVYMMQQIAPGKHKMTHYAYATALMQLVLIPTQWSSGPLADWLGYKSFFVFVLVASIPSILAAWRAPFPDPVDVDEASELPAAASVERDQGAAAAASS